MRWLSTLTYVEEDGFEIHRGKDTYWVYGTCTETYEYSFYPGKKTGPWEDSYPDEGGLEPLGDTFQCMVEAICDKEGNEVKITLTDEERHAFNDFMRYRMDITGEASDFEDYMDSREEMRGL